MCFHIWIINLKGTSMHRDPTCYRTRATANTIARRRQLRLARYRVLRCNHLCPCLRNTDSHCYKNAQGALFPTTNTDSKEIPCTTT